MQSNSLWSFLLILTLLFVAGCGHEETEYEKLMRELNEEASEARRGSERRLRESVAANWNKALADNVEVDKAIGYVGGEFTEKYYARKATKILQDGLDRAGIEGDASTLFDVIALEDEQYTFQEPAVAVVTATALNVRTSPRGAKLGVVEQGEHVMLKRYTTEWVQLDGGKWPDAWISKKHVQVLASQ